MKKKITSAIAAGSLVGGIAIGSFVAPPMAAFAADTSTSASANATARTPGQWITDSLKGLVDKGTITQAQSDSIASTLQAAQPQGHGGRGGHGMDLSAAATALGISQTDLQTAMQTKSLADIAKDRNVDVNKVIDALVTADNNQIDQRVKDGTITQTQADSQKANTKQRVTDMVNSIRAGGPDGHGPGGPGAGGPGAPEGGSTASTTAPTTNS